MNFSFFRFTILDWMPKPWIEVAQHIRWVSSCESTEFITKDKRQKKASVWAPLPTTALTYEKWYIYIYIFCCCQMIYKWWCGGDVEYVRKILQRFSFYNYNIFVVFKESSLWFNNDFCLHSICTQLFVRNCQNVAPITMPPERIENENETGNEND